MKSVWLVLKFEFTFSSDVEKTNNGYVNVMKTKSFLLHQFFASVDECDYALKKLRELTILDELTRHIKKIESSINKKYLELSWETSSNLLCSDGTVIDSHKLTEGIDRYFKNYFKEFKKKALPKI